MKYWLAAGAAFWAGCHSGAPPVLREQARAVLQRHCGACHVPDRPTALAAALAVFDLSEPDWSRRMDERRLRSALWRLGEPIPPDGKPNDVSDAERARFARFVEAELAARAEARP